MATQFLLGFSRTVVRRLVDEGALELTGPEDVVAVFIANWLGTVKQNAQLIPELVGALVACPQVAEVYLDDEELARLLEDLGTGWRHG